jgi:hypothetical protein
LSGIFGIIMNRSASQSLKKHLDDLVPYIDLPVPPYIGIISLVSGIG